MCKDKKTILISACLLGLNCRYDGASKPCAEAIALAGDYNLVPVCPEIYGGLPTPRTPSERIGDKTMMRDGTDVTDNYKRGAKAALALCKSLSCDCALLKAKSPSCGKGEIYDGSFTGKLTARDGVTAELLASEGVRVFTELEISQMKKYLDKN